MKEPPRFESWNPAMRGAYRKGYEAAIAGLCASECPYQDKRKDCGRLTWSRAFRAAWHDGWLAGEHQRNESARRAIDEYYKDRNNSGQAALTAHL